jgi:glycine cleavage system aminomethyltransferase T
MASLLGGWVSELRFFRFREIELEGIPLVVARSGWSKQGGFELYLRDGTRGAELWDLVVESGRPHDIRPGAPSSIERIESGLLAYGSDMTLDDTPFECGLEGYCDLDKTAAFAARAALTVPTDGAASRRLARIVVDGPPTSGEGLPWPVAIDAETVGMVTSAAYCPRLERKIAFAMLPLVTHETGAPLRIRLPGSQQREGSFVGDINAPSWG